MLQNDILLQQHKKHQTLKVQVKLTMGYNLQWVTTYKLQFTMH